MTDQAPLPDYDHLPVSAIESRIRTLAADPLEQLLAYERAHAARPLVVTAIQHRLEQLRSGASPSGGDPGAVAPEAGAEAPSPQTTTPSTDAPPVNPPSHGDPSNPAQPRS